MGLQKSQRRSRARPSGSAITVLARREAVFVTRQRLFVLENLVFAPNAGSTDLIPGQGTRISHATWCGQN